MKILIIGGSQFVGKHIALEGLKNGHQVSMFNRGKSNPEGIEGVRNIIGDRDGGLSVLNDELFDIVIDTCGYFPRVVKDSCDFFRGKLKQYVFISTISVYDDDKVEEDSIIDEDFVLGEMESPETEEVDKGTYGPLKVLCEDVVKEAFEDNHLIIRPGYIIGPDDYTDRFPYWVKRIAEGGEVVVPDNKLLPMQGIDVRDLGGWIIHLIDNDINGIYNAVGPKESFSYLEMLEIINKTFGNKSSWKMISEDFLVENEITGRELPLWSSLEYKNTYPLMKISIEKMLENGMKYRPFEETIKDTLDFVNSRADDYEWRSGLTREQELELIEKWDKANG